MLEIHHTHFPSIDSTQDYLKRESKQLDADVLFCVTADEQTKGRGRGTKKWISPPEKNLYISFHFISEKMENIAQLLTISAMKYLREIPILLKWPNDLLINYQKVGGVICEVVNSTHVIVGLGLNVLMSRDECDKIDQKATSLFLETGNSYSIFELALGVASQFQQDLHLFMEEGFSPFLFFIEPRIAYKNELVEIDVRGIKTRGTFLKIEESGALLLQKEDGSIASFLDGSLVVVEKR